MALSSRDQKALGALAAALVVWLLLSFVALPSWDRWQQSRAELPVREAALIKYRQALATAGSEPGQALSLQKRLQDVEGGLLEGGTPALASAQLQNWIKQITSGLEIEVRSSEFLPVRPQPNGYAQVPLGLVFQCRLEQLTTLLTQLRAGPRIVSIPRFSVQSAGGDEKQLNVGLTVAGVMRWSQEQQTAAQ